MNDNSGLRVGRGSEGDNAKLPGMDATIYFSSGYSVFSLPRLKFPRGRAVIEIEQRPFIEPLCKKTINTLEDPIFSKKKCRLEIFSLTFSSKKFLHNFCSLIFLGFSLVRTLKTVR